jgi:hypothetical protein
MKKASSMGSQISMMTPRQGREGLEKKYELQQSKALPRFFFPLLPSLHLSLPLSLQLFLLLSFSLLLV